MSSTSRDINIDESQSADRNDDSQELIPGFSNITEFSQQSLRAVLHATKASNELPTGDDYDFYSTYDAVRNVLDIEARRILQLLQNLLRHQNIRGTITGTDHALEIDEQFDVIIDGNDQILERVGTWVDEATGVKKNDSKLVIATVMRNNPAIASWNKKAKSSSSPSSMRLLTAKNIQRPQLSFRDKIDNSNKVFRPILQHKPNALKSLSESLKLPEGVTVEDTETADFMYPHPYQYELDAWQPSNLQLEKNVPQKPKSLDETPLHYVDAPTDLAELCDLLKQEKEIAVDLEHHSYRTFQGFVCLMQISTRDQDYLIDTLSLRADMYILNEIFTDPKITKVFHGADSDIEWLQRDFGIYVVNMFDTGQAARVLNMARFSLRHLLHVYCQVEANKQFQLADWRIRPLPDELVQYAREDTHYLLFIYDRMQNELIEQGNEQKNLLCSVYQRSKMVCLKVFKKVSFQEDSHLELYKKSKKVFSSQQLLALKNLYAWRDTMARMEDESTQYILPNHMLLQIAEILPRERQGVLACCNPIPPLVRQFQHEIHAIVLEAREATLTQMEIKPNIQPSDVQHPRYHLEPLLSCPHDLSHQRFENSEFDSQISDVNHSSRSGFGGKSAENITVLETPSLQALAANKSHVGGCWSRKVADMIRCSFVNPFLKYFPKDIATQSAVLSEANHSTHIEHGLSWRLKQNTVSAQKRKDSVDLEIFEPEFVPRAKMPHLSPPSTSTSLTSYPNSKQQENMCKEEKEDGETLVSLRQQKKKKKNKEKNKIQQDNLTDMTSGISETASVDSQRRKEKKKKRKDKKPTQKSIDEVAENFKPYDYSVTDKSSFTGEKKKKTQHDVYNPSFHDNKAKQRKGKKNKFGAKQRKSLTFKASSEGKGKR